MSLKFNLVEKSPGQKATRNMGGGAEISLMLFAPEFVCSMRIWIFLIKCLFYLHLFRKQ